MTINGKKYKVRDIMREPVVIHNDLRLKDALEALVTGKRNIACVVDTEGKLLGAISTLDIIRAILPDYLETDTVAAQFADDAMLKEDVEKSACTPIAEFVNSEETIVDSDTSLLEATVLSAGEEHSRIIVVDADKKPIGILTRSEIKQVLAAYLCIENTLDESCTPPTCR